MNTYMVRKTLVVLFVVVLVVARALSQSPHIPDWALVHTRTMEGIDSLYNFKFTTAEAKFNDVIRMAPQDPRGYFFKAMISYYRFEFMSVETDYDRFIELSDSVIEVAENVIDNDEKNSAALFYLGGIYGYRGIVKSEKDEILSAVWDGKKGYGYLCDALEIDPKNYDAMMGVGLFNYYLSKIPKAFRWIATAIGFDADRELGLRMLERTARKGTYARNEARWWLSQFYQWEGETEKGVQYLKELSESYPNNPFYVQRYGYALLFSLRRVDEAIPVFKKSVSMTNWEAQRYITQGYHRLGHCYRFKSEYKEAIEAYTKFITSVTLDTAQQLYAHYCIGLCYEMMGDRDSALPYYQKSPAYASERLKQPMNEYDIEFEKMSNWFSAGYYTKGFDAGFALLARKDLTDDQQGNILWEIASTYFEQKDYTQASNKYMQATGLTIKNKSWMPPFAYYRLGLCNLRNGQEDLAKKAFEKALEFEKYDNEEYIREVVEEELDKIND